MDREKTSITELVAATGVSRDVINKLRSREDSSTTVENALLISAFYGKTVNQFVEMSELSQEDSCLARVELLRPEERLLLDEQIRGILARRGRE